MNMDLTVQEQKYFEKLIANAERNKVEAQQLALDAGKLLTVTAERLEDYKDRGFFKRCWYKISGKQDELNRANQTDLIAMQKYAWIYLMKLQEQNLIQAQAIAVIRNNLKDVMNEIAEIHDMISVIVEKFDELDARVKDLEQTTELHDWLLHIEAKDDIQRSSPRICVLQLTFDYLNVLQKNNIDYAAIERSDDLKVAMRRFGIDSSERLTVDTFIVQLFDEIQLLGYRLFRNIISLHANETVIDCQYILENVSGAGYNALYCFAQEMDHMANLAKQLKKDDPKETMLAAIRSVLNNPQTEYSILELAQEILCGSLLTEEIFKVENGICDEIAPAPSSSGEVFSTESFLEEYVSITYHAFLDTSPQNDGNRLICPPAPTQEEKICYLESFALLFKELGGITDRQRHYVMAISRLFGCENCMDRIEFLTSNHRKIDVPSIIAMLSTPKRQYTWFADIIYLGNCDGSLNPGGRNVTLAVATRLLKLEKDDLLPFLEKMEQLAVENDRERLTMIVSAFICDKTSAWKTILEFRGVSGVTGYSILSFFNSFIFANKKNYVKLD